MTDAHTQMSVQRNNTRPGKYIYIIYIYALDHDLDR